MAEPTIKCPKCKFEIKLTEAMAGPLIEAERKEFEVKMDALRVEAFREGEQKAHKKSDAVLDQQTSEMGELKQQLQGQEGKLAEAQKAQATYVKAHRELDEEKRELDLTIEKRIEGGLEAAYDRAKAKADVAAEGRISQKDEVIRSMSMEVENLRRKAEQGSQQAQGETLELEMEKALRDACPRDQIEPVPKGVSGVDLVQTVITPGGVPAGIILWETKRTKVWSDGWLPKLRDDQRASKADVAVIVSDVVPKGVEPFALVDGIWVVIPKVAMPLALLLREAVLDIASARHLAAGQEDRKALVYQYLTGSQFKQRVQAIIESFTTMSEDLEGEKRSITKQWAKREAQIKRVMTSTVGMYGDLQGIAGKSLPEIKELEFTE